MGVFRELHSMPENKGLCDFCVDVPKPSAMCFPCGDFTNAEWMEKKEPMTTRGGNVTQRLEISLDSRNDWYACIECGRAAERNDIPKLVGLNPKAFGNTLVVGSWQKFVNSRLQGPPAPYDGAAVYNIGPTKITTVYQ